MTDNHIGLWQTQSAWLAVAKYHHFGPGQIVHHDQKYHVGQRQNKTSFCAETYHVCERQEGSSCWAVTKHN